MALRTGHGNGAGVPRIEVLPADELPAPIPAPPRGDEPRKPVAERREGGLFARGEGTRALSLRANEIRWSRLRLIDKLGLGTIAADPTFAPFIHGAEEFVDAHLAELAVLAGGTVGTGPSTMVASAALQLAASRWAYTRAAALPDPDMVKLGSTLSNDSRQNLHAAYEYAVKVGKALAANPDVAKKVKEAEAKTIAADAKAMAEKREKERQAQREQGEELEDGDES
jgi:hypothetical protein